LVYHDARGLFQDKAHTERSRVIITRLLGQLFRYRETRIVLYQSVGRQTERFLKSHAFWPSIASVERQDILLGDPVEKNAALINEFKPDLIQSYASYLTLLYAHFLRTGEPFHRPRVILYYADAMSDSFKRMMEEELKIPVFSFYGAAEAMGIGFDCEHHLGLHVNIDLYPTRVVDGNGKSLPDGESGDVVVSNLVNRGTVLLNYRLGDISALLPDQCPCGRSLPLVSYPPGRCDDFIRLPSGKIMHPVPLRFIFCDQDVWEYQVIQKTSTSFEVVIIPNQKCDVPKTKERIAERFAQTFGDDITVEISFVESIDRPASGKSRPIVSMVQSSPLDLMPEKGND
jgi:phenylacetate-CoA ligase